VKPFHPERTERAPPAIYKREPEHDRRIRRGDDFAGDAWRNTETGELSYVAVGVDPNISG